LKSALAKTKTTKYLAQAKATEQAVDDTTQAKTAEQATDQAEHTV
jgi:hypothetical protein